MSDLSLNASAFVGAPAAAAAATNAQLMKLQGTLPNWWDIGAAKYRQMRENGETALPRPTRLPDAQTLSLPSRDAGRSIPARLILPDHQQKGQQPGVYLHIHGGGWVLMSERDQDPLLKDIANGTGLAVLSIGYRLAPEHAFPAGPNDCYDAAEHLVDHASEEFGAPLLFVGGESAGGHLSALVVLHLLKSRPGFGFRGAVLNYGCFNLSTPFPSSRQWKLPLVLTQEIMAEYFKAFLPGWTETQRADPAVSPFWAEVFVLNDRQEGVGAKLPPALMVCGTIDPLLDDTVLFGAKWQMAGAEATVKIYRGLPHGFNLFPDDALPGVAESKEMTNAWLKGKM